MDLLLGRWAKDNLAALTDAQMDEFDQILSLETPDILKIMLGQNNMPEVGV